MTTPEEIIVRHPSYLERAHQWKKIRDSIEGEDKIKEGGAAYLPVPGGQTSQNDPRYKAYKLRASFFAVTERTLAGLLGLVFRINSTFELPTAMEYLEERATPDGLGLNSLAREAMKEQLSIGRYGLLVDLPAGENTDLRPYVSRFKAEDIWNWDTKFVDGEEVLTRVVLHEDAEGSFDKSRLLELKFEGDVYVMVIWEKKDERASAKEEYVVIDTVQPDRNGKPLDRIPFVFLPMTRVAKPAMLDLSNTNISHYRNSADYEQSLFLTGQPTPYIFGVDEPPPAMGSSTVWHSPKADAKAGMLEFKGAGIQALKEAMQEKEGRMAVLGARIIRDDSERSNITAETTRLNSRSDTSVLLDTTDWVEKRLRDVLNMIAEWVGVATEVEFALNRDHVETRMDPASIGQMVAGWQAQAYSYDTLFENLQRGEIIPPERTMEEELRLIAKLVPPMMVDANDEDDDEDEEDDA